MEHYSGKITPRSLDLWIGGIFFFFMTWLAWEYFLERICYQDTAAYTVELIKKQSFAIVHDRYGASLSQIIPVILLHFKAPLKAVMIGYSVNFILLYFLCFWFCLSICRHRSAAYAICLLLVFTVKLTFYWPVTELLQGMIYCVVFFAWWNSKKERIVIVHYAVGFLLGMLALNTHSLTCVVLVLVIAYDFLDQRDRRLRDRALRLSLCIIPVGYVYFFNLNSSYEQAQLPSMSGLHIILTHLMDLKGTRMIWEYITGENSVILGGLGLLVLVLGYRGKWSKLGLVFCFHLGYGLLLCITYPYGVKELAYENLCLPFAFCQTIFLAHELLIPNVRLWFPQIALGVLTCFFTIQIQGRNNFFQAKKAHYESIANSLEGFPDRKLVLSSYNYPHYITEMTWPSFAESLLFSGLKGPDESFSFYVAQEYENEEIQEIEKGEDLLLEYPWLRMGYQVKLPKYYFNLPARPYRFVNEANAVSADSLLTLLSNSEMECIDPFLSYTAGTTPYFKIRFYNNSPDPIPSSRLYDNSLFIAYRFYWKGELVDWQSPKQPLLMDIVSVMEQLVRVKLPEQKEKIEIQFGLVSHHGDEMFLTSPRYPIELFKSSEFRVRSSGELEIRGLHGVSRSEN